MNDESIYYPEYYDKDFSKVMNKYEFKEQPKRQSIYADPRQLLMRNLISKNTIYSNILMFWEVGRGKSASAILIAEGFKEYVLNMGRRIVVLVKNSNIEENFRAELLSDVTQNAYIQGDVADYLKTADQESKKELMNKINRKINKIYDFITYGTFINQVLGAKIYEKDKLNHNTKKKVKNLDGTDARKKSNANFNLNNTVIIVDEAHNITNNDFYVALTKALENSYNYRLILLTATPMYDNPKEIFELSNLLNMDTPEKLYPIRNDLFKGEYPIMIKTESQTGILKSGLTEITDYGKELLINSLKGKVSFFQVNTETFPEQIDIGEPLNNMSGSIKIVYCKMSKYQYNIYKKALLLDTRADISIDEVINLDFEENIEVENGIAKSSSLYKNSSDASTMVYPNETYGKDGFNLCFKEEKGNTKLKPEYNNILKLNGDLYKYSSKLKTLIENVNNSPGNIFIYSNYVNQGGTALIKQLLLANGYHEFKSKGQNIFKTFILYDESYTSKEREYYRGIFNNNDNNRGKYIKIIIGSPLISEGITLKNIRQIHILEPSWNMSTLNQIIGRGIRHYSHASLPLEERNVKVYKYCSIDENNKVYCIDKEKYILSEEKDRSNKVVERLLKRLSFDCELNKKEGINGSVKCDYTDCNYKCFVKNTNKKIDKFTYNLYINFFDEFDIDLNIYLIKEKFKEYFVWSLIDLIDYIKQYEPAVSNESIFVALKQMIDNKIIIDDQYNRDGFIIQKGDYFIFNPINIDINSSIYSKMLDFSVNSNEYTLNDYVKIKNISLDKPIVKNIKEKLLPTVLSDFDISYNKKIIKNNKIYGSYRSRAIKDEEFGPIDNKFKIIDIRDLSEQNIEDKRKNITGMAASSYKKNDLQNIYKYLKITQAQTQKYLEYSNNIDIDKLSTKQLIQIIQEHLKFKSAILK